MFRALSSWFEARIGDRRDSDPTGSGESATVVPLAEENSIVSDSEAARPRQQVGTRKREQWSPEEKYILVMEARRVRSSLKAAARYRGRRKPRVSVQSLASAIRKWRRKVQGVHDKETCIGILSCQRTGTKAQRQHHDRGIVTVPGILRRSAAPTQERAEEELERGTRATQMQFASCRRELMRWGRESPP